MKQFKNSKRYLTGIDWLMHTFDHMNQKMIRRGNEFHFVLEIDGLIDVSVFEKEINRFINQYSVFKGRASRAINLAPYWKINHTKENNPIVLSAVNIQDQSSLISHFIQIFNNQDHLKDMYLDCDIVFCDNISYVLFTFSHKVFDGSGAELFIEAFGNYVKDKENYIVQDVFVEPSHLEKWKEKFQAGKDVNQKLIGLSPQGNMRSLPIESGQDFFQFKVIHFSEEQTKKILERADNEMGYLLSMPFLLAQVVAVVNQLFDKKGISKDSLIVPVTVNARKKHKAKEIFFNHLSFMFFQFIAGEENNLNEVIKEQLYDQMKSKFTDQFEKNAMLMRIAPVSVLSKLMGLYSKGKMASFSFSYLGETGFSSDELFGKKVSNLFHLPCPSVPPGLGFFVNNYRGKMNLTISYLDSLLYDEDISFLVNKLESISDE